MFAGYDCAALTSIEKPYDKASIASLSQSYLIDPMSLIRYHSLPPHISPSTTSAHMDSVPEYHPRIELVAHFVSHSSIRCMQPCSSQTHPRFSKELNTDDSFQPPPSHLHGALSKPPLRDRTTGVPHTEHLHRMSLQAPSNAFRLE